MVGRWIHVVVNGKRVGIYDDFREYGGDVLTYPGIIYKKFRTVREACDFIVQNLDEGKVKIQFIEMLTNIIRSLRPGCPYVCKSLRPAGHAGNVFQPPFVVPHTQGEGRPAYEVGQSSITANSFHSGNFSIDSMGATTFVAYPQTTNTTHWRRLADKGFEGIISFLFVVFIVVIILITTVLLIALCRKV